MGMKHPSIVKFIQSFPLHEEQKVALVMEYLSGGELLRKLVKKGSFNEEEARNVIIQIL
jgi:serine/threonine protein kinase